METVAEKQQKAFEALREALGYRNPMQVPRLEKIVVSTGVGKVKEKDKIALIQDRLARLTGQKAAPRPAKKSIASFKTRKGDIVGYQVTLRGARMRDFFDKLVHIALPRTRDFRGIKPSAIDAMGNITIGVREHTVFPEVSDEDLRNIFGLAVTIVTTAKTKKEAEAYLRYLGFPLRDAGEAKRE